jgi:hypothetical protein
MAKWVKSLGIQTLEEQLVQYRKDHPTWPEELLQPMCESKKQLDSTIFDVMSPRMHSTNGAANDSPGCHPACVALRRQPGTGRIVTPEVVAKVRELNPNVSIVSVPTWGTSSALTSTLSYGGFAGLPEAASGLI